MQQTISPTINQPNYRQAMAAAHISFVLTGVVTVMLGPVLPVLAAKWSLDDAQAGYLFTAQFAGSLTAAAGISRLIARVGLLRALVVGYALMSAGVAALGVTEWVGGITSVFVYGVGLGITIPATNFFISELYPSRRAAALSIVNFTWCIGAVACAPLIGALAEGGNTTTGLFALSSLMLLLAIWLLRSHTNGAVEKREEKAQDKNITFHSPFVLLIGALIFLYVGTENAVAGWIATHALRMEGGTDSGRAIMPSFFWAALLVGRLAAPLALRRIAEEKLALAGLVAAACGVALISSTSTVSVLAPSVALAGAGFACVYPITIAMLPRCFGASATRVASLIFMLAGLGGAILPWVVGFVSSRSGSLRAGLLVPLFTSLGMIALQIIIIAVLGRTAKSNVKYKAQNDY